jgi:hypothetical protein
MCVDLEKNIKLKTLNYSKKPNISILFLLLSTSLSLHHTGILHISI